MSNFMRLEDAIEIVLELATDNVLDARQEIALATVEDFFVNNVFEGE